ncbi:MULTISPECIES: hypothetical protein [Lysinibacillus]|nr:MULTISPECIES: hypothetical protein [Lysinibacillus]
MFDDELLVEIGSIKDKRILGRFDRVRGETLRLIEELIGLTDQLD